MGEERASVSNNPNSIKILISKPEDTRRRSSIFPSFLRQNRKDSIFLSESTTQLYPFQVEDIPPTIQGYSQKQEIDITFKFGWINGVYVRTVLNIFGVMLFLRMGWMTGQAGIPIALGMVLVSTLITFCTAISMSAICTNGEVGTGGIYYMISRSLGAEAGSMIGLVFSFANAVLVSLNLVGAAETLVEILYMYDLNMTDELNDTRIVGALFLILVAIIPFIGMDWEAKAMFVFLIILLSSLLNYFVGTFIPPTEEQRSQGFIGWAGWVAKANMGPKFDGASIEEVFAVFFPSVIGIFAGASMSGDLKDPNEAIPKGTFLAIITTSSLYVILIVFLGCTIVPYASDNYNLDGSAIDMAFRNQSGYGLISNYQTMALSSGFGPLIYAGIFAATISSALGSFVCAPRIFQALCEDELFPYIKYFAKGYGKINDPRRGYVLTFIISLIFVAIGNLNTIAPLISNFFLASFFLVNIACFHASFVESPSFRPSFKFYNKWVSLLTGVVCIVVMFFMDYISALITVLVMGLIWLYVAKKCPDVNWGSSKKSHIYMSALASALKLDNIEDHIRNFRPSILLLTGNPSARIPIVEFTSSLTKNKSLLLIGHIVNKPIEYKVRQIVVERQYQWMAKRKIKGFYLLLESETLKSGVKSMLQISGLGRRLRANTLMLGYKSSWQECLIDDLMDYFNVILTGLEMEMAIAILRIQEGLDYADLLSTDSDKSKPDGRTLSTIVEPNGINIEQKVNEGTNNNSANKKVNTTTKPSKEAIESIKILIPNDIVDAINQFNRKQRKGTIDIWWLTDDGGLTLLMPYILSLNENWSDCGLRIISMSKSAEEIEKIQIDLQQLVTQLRIPCSSVEVFAASEIEVEEISRESFKNSIRNFMEETDSNNKMKITKNNLKTYQDITNRYLKLRSLLMDHSRDATLIVMTLPLPNPDMRIPLYMAWLEILTANMPPFLFVRGNKIVMCAD